MTDAAEQLAFNGAVLARHGELVVRRSFGTADAQDREPVTPSTRFNIGSAGKIFTALSIAILIERGAVDLDAPIGQYLHNLPPAVAAITTAQLLDHTSGLGNYLVPANRAIVESATTASQLLPVAIASLPAFAPGSRRSYSNSGFVVLGAIVEKVSRRTYAEFVQREILDVLGMADTRLDGTSAAEPMTRMSPSGPLVRPQPSPFRGQRASPAGGIVSTVDDLSRLVSAFGGDRIVRRGTLERFFSPRPEPNGGAGLYGLGFNVRNSPRLRIGHGGGAPGVNAEVAAFPGTGWQLIALSNNDPPAATRLVEVLEEAVFADDPEAACRNAIDKAKGTPSMPRPAAR
ncbi:MAG: beta-lactamase family protein [Pseudomonadota bacterium]|nr:beta-lactamase family protein [Pseudomonadota bacterium]